MTKKVQLKNKLSQLVNKLMKIKSYLFDPSYNAYWALIPVETKTINREFIKNNY